MMVRKNTGGAFGALRSPSEDEGLAKDLVAVKEYIKEHCREPLTCGTVSEALGLSESYLEKIFGREVGATISQYVLMCRMERSSELLVETSMRIREICEAVGMKTPGWYSKCFHRCYGISPSEYRRTEQRGLPLPEMRLPYEENPGTL